METETSWTRKITTDRSGESIIIPVWKELYIHSVWEPIRIPVGEGGRGSSKFRSVVAAEAKFLAVATHQID
jgi:hypothetical protein